MRQCVDVLMQGTSTLSLKPLLSTVIASVVKQSAITQADCHVLVPRTRNDTAGDANCFIPTMGFAMTIWGGNKVFKPLRGGATLPNQHITTYTYNSILIKNNNYEKQNYNLLFNTNFPLFVK